jgi:chromate transporter
MNQSDHGTLLVGHLALLSVISFGGVQVALPDLRDFVIAQGCITAEDFANCFAVVQAIPGPNMILLTGFVGWQIGGWPVAVASSLATFIPSCAVAFVAFNIWDRFRDRHWQGIARRGLAPVTIGLVIAGGTVMARTGDPGWAGYATTAAATGLTLLGRFNPLWIIAGAAVLGACGLI